MANFGDYLGDYRHLIWRQGDKVQNLESPKLSGRVDSTAGIYWGKGLRHWQTGHE